MLRAHSNMKRAKQTRERQSESACSTSTLLIVQHGNTEIELNDDAMLSLFLLFALSQVTAHVYVFACV